MPQHINTETSRPASTESRNVESIKVGGRRTVPLISEESPSSVKSLYRQSSASDQDMDATNTTDCKSSRSATGTRVASPPSSTSPGRPKFTINATAATTTTDRIQRIMNDPEEWKRFRDEMKKGGHCTNAAAALDQLIKRAREEEEKAKKKAEQEAEQGPGTVCEDKGQAGVNANDKCGEEAGHHSNLVNKGLRWINQTLTATANISQEAEVSMNSQLSYYPSSDRSINRSQSMSNDRPIFLEGTLGDRTTSSSESPESTRAGGIGQPARRSRRGGRRRGPLNHEPDGSGGGVSRQLPHRRNSADAVLSLGGYLTTNISAHADEDPMSLKSTKGQDLPDTNSYTNALFDRHRVLDEDMDVGASISGDLNIPKGGDKGKSNLISETAKAVRRGSGSLVEYLSGIATIGQDTSSSDDGRPAHGSGDGLLEGWSGGREMANTSARSDMIKQRGGRRVRSRSFDMLEAMQKGLGHEIDADDFIDGGGH